MTTTKKSTKNILEKLGIESLNPMQEEALEAIANNKQVLLLSPTGTGKTLAFLLPIIETLKSDIEEVQMLIVVPSRELAIQIEQVVREMGTGFKTNAVYGGRAGSLDKIDLKHRPAILIGTPGRIADHLRRRTFTNQFIKTLVLDEFDKSLETGFEAEMREICAALPKVDKKILTSATQRSQVPAFVKFVEPKIINYLLEGVPQLQLRTIVSPANSNKLETLVKALNHIGNKPGIVFCNLKGTVEEVSNYLEQNGISHGCFSGNMEQTDREKALIKFRNGTHPIIVATDLAARGLDIPEIKFIIHYELPQKQHEFVHRNGRTARMNAQGTAYVLKEKNQVLPSFIQNVQVEKLFEGEVLQPTEWTTIYVSGGRKDKISKGDIAGLFLKQGKLTTDELGTIEIKQDCAFVAVKADKADELIDLVNNTKLKTKKVRVSSI